VFRVELTTVRGRLDKYRGFVRHNATTTKQARRIVPSLRRTPPSRELRCCADLPPLYASRVLRTHLHLHFVRRLGVRGEPHKHTLGDHLFDERERDSHHSFHTHTPPNIPSEYTQREPFAFKDLMIHSLLQFALRFAFRCVLHRG
jgi:hypothetical protein